MIKDYRAALDEGRHLIDPVISDYHSKFSIDWTPYIGVPYTEKCDTTVSMDELQRLSKRLTTCPPNFTLHSRVQKIIDDRKLMGEGKLPVDWGMGENLAYASLVAAGYNIRVSGEDVGRGTFFHRHAALHDQNREKWDEGTYWPLQNIQENQGRFMCFDSVLSEEAVLAFEYGFATAAPNELVVWEAQFGDFANGAQVVIDQFLVVRRSQVGPRLRPRDAAAARLRRAGPGAFVGAPRALHAAFRRIQLGSLRALQRRAGLSHAAPADAAQAAQAADRHDAEVAAAPQGRHQFAGGTGQRHLPDHHRREVDKVDPKKVTRMVACAGKIYFDLLAARREKKIENVALVRVEQLYPFDDRRLFEEMEKYPKLKELIWCQEEPMNQGAWYAKHHRLERLIKKGQST
jgi:2-oxoglutarate dehydrogenase E1 component